MTDADPLAVRAGARSRLAVLAMMVAAALFGWFVIGQRYWLDDSFISFRYARNLFEGHGLVYNPGDPVEGYTNFLWTMVAWLALVVRQEPMYFAQAVSTLAMAVTLWSTWRIGRAMGRRGWGALLAPLLLCTQVAFLAYPMTGMETTFFSMFVALGCQGFVERWHDTRRGGVLLGVVLLGVGLTRFDGFVLAGILFSYPLLFESGRRRVLVPLVCLAAGLAIYNAWRLSYYPTPLPNTFYAKTSFSIGRAYKGLDYVEQFGLVSLLPLALAILPVVLRRIGRHTRYLLWILGWQAAYVILVGGDWMPHFRFLVPVMPVLYLLAQEGAMLRSERPVGPGLLPRLRGVLPLGVLLAFHVVPLVRGRDFTDLSGKHFHQHQARRIGEYLDAHYPADRLIAIEWGGIIPYYTHHRVLDTFGLTDREICRLPFRRDAFGTWITSAYLARRGPDMIVPNAAPSRSEEQAWKTIQPGGINDYKWYRSMDRAELGYEFQVFDLGDGWYWPALVRRADAASGSANGP